MTCDLVKFDFPITESRWVTAHLPVQFRIESERFPENRIDDIDSVESVTEGEGGLALFNLAGTYEFYEAGEYVKISNSTLGAYDGIWRIVSAFYPTELLLEVSFLGDATADLQRYYRNYAIKIDVWAGIPNGHALNSQRPISRKTEKPLLYRPRLDNIAYVDISDFVRADLPQIDNRLCESIIENADTSAPDISLWTSFFIAYSEVWDIFDVDGNAIQANTTTQVLGPQLISNPQFLDGSGTIADNWFDSTNPDTPAIANGWLRYFVTSPLVNTFTASIRRPSTGFWVGAFSKYFTQTNISTVAGRRYRIFVDYFRLAPFAGSETDFFFFYDLTAGLTIGDRVLLGTISESGSIVRNTASFEFTALNSNMRLGFVAQPNTAQTEQLSIVSLQMREVTEITIDPNDPDPSSTIQTEIFYATQSVQQFQYRYGNSMGEYSAPETGGVFEGKFMTIFEEPVLFDGYELDLAIILPDNEIYPATEMVWTTLDKNRNFIATGELAINYQDEGVYRFIVSDIPYGDNAVFIEVYVENSAGRLSEIKTIRIDRKTCRDGVYLRWLNFLGGWDSWLFTGFQDFAVEFTDIQETKRDIFNIWDSKFVNGNTQGDYVRVQSQQSRIVRSQYLSESEVDAIRWIKQSVKVQQINKALDCSDKKRKTVLVDKTAFTFKSNRKGLREIEFTIRETNNDLTQTQ